MKKILTITMNPAIDVSTEVEKVAPVRKLRCGSPRREPGGGGINVARVLNRLGAPVAALFPAGGNIGGLLESLVAGEGIDHQSVPIAGETRENFTATETETGDQYRFVLKGPDMSAAEQQGCLDAVARALPGAGLLVASGSLPASVPDDFYASLAAVAAAAGVPFVVDSSGPALRGALGAGVALIKPNLRELSDLAGQALEGEAAQLEACRALVDGGRVDAVALTLGAEGGLLVTAGGAWRARAPQVTVASAVGAGDSFTAGMVFALASGEPLDQAFALGIAAGAAAVLTPGTELCRADDVQRLRDAVTVEPLGR